MASGGLNPHAVDTRWFGVTVYRLGERPWMWNVLFRFGRKKELRVVWK